MVFLSMTVFAQPSKAGQLTALEVRSTQPLRNFRELLIAKRCLVAKPVMVRGFCTAWNAARHCRTYHRKGSKVLANRLSWRCPCLKMPVDRSDSAFARAFREYEFLCYLHTARVQLEPRYDWDNSYRSSEIKREVVTQARAAKTERNDFECLAWLYDGFTPAKKSKGGSRCE
jgi:hypothetical protein